MTRKTLVAAVKEAATELGLCFHSGFRHQMNQSIVAYPALWAVPPKIIAANGTREGQITYRTTVYLMSMEPKASQDAKDNTWELLEQTALQLARAIGEKKHIAGVTVTDCSPAEYALTNHGDIAVAMTFDARIFFCNL